MLVKEEDLKKLFMSKDRKNSRFYTAYKNNENFYKSIFFNKHTSKLTIE